MLSAGYTYCVFQCESAGIRNVITRLKPQNIEDIIAVISLYRPGPMDSIGRRKLFSAAGPGAAFLPEGAKKESPRGLSFFRRKRGPAR